MDEESAQNVIRTSIRMMALLNQLVADLQKTMPADAFDAQRLVIGGIMGDVGLNLINPAVALHPSLRVDDEDAWRQTGQLTASHWLRHDQDDDMPIDEAKP